MTTPAQSTASAPSKARADAREQAPFGRRGARRIAGIVAAVLVAVVGFKLVGLYDATRRAASTEAQLSAEIDALGTEIAGLRTQEAVVGTDAYVERWAREERGWIREGDHPFAVAVVTAAPTATAAATPSADGPLDRLGRWLLGAPEPMAEPSP